MDGVIYLFIGTKHANHFAVSLMTLRDWWDGPVAIMHASSDESGTAFLDKHVRPNCPDIQFIDVDYTPRRKAGKSGKGR